MKAVVAAFNQEKALVGAFSVIMNLRMDLFEALVVGGLSAALTSCIREIQRERSVAPLSSAQTQASTMKIGSRGKYFAKFWEIIEKFQTVVTNRVLGLTSRERRLLEKMQREHSSRQQTCVSYIIVRKKYIYIEILKPSLFILEETTYKYT